ncbi:MAG: ASPIC/UnbV domain-containing protein [Planctomycetaceae bacterium]|nr:ASPIC/UnbV domain-containing protein [Planctomycetaceae bacterium]
MPTALNFGLGDVQSVSQVTVYWPSGTVQEVKSVPVDAHITIREDEDWQMFAGTVTP